MNELLIKCKDVENIIKRFNLIFGEDLFDDDIEDIKTCNKFKYILYETIANKIVIELYKLEDDDEVSDNIYNTLISNISQNGFIGEFGNIVMKNFNGNYESIALLLLDKYYDILIPLLKN